MPDILHKVSRNGDMAICGARRFEGARFAYNWRHITCQGCAERVVANREAAQARFAAVAGNEARGGAR